MKTETGQINNKSVARAIAGWQGKGFDVSGATDASEMMEAAGLDWRIELSPIFTPNGTETPWKQAIKSVGGIETPLSIVPDDRWQPISNYVFCSRARAIADNFQGKVLRAGWVKKQTKAVTQSSFCWAMVQPGMGIVEDCATDGYEDITPYILLTSGTCYGIGYHCRLMFVRSVCQNGLIDRQSTAVRETHQTSNAFENFTVKEVKDSVAAYLKEKEMLMNVDIRDNAAYGWFVNQFGKAGDRPFADQPLQMRTLWEIYTGECDNLLAESGIDLAQSRIKGTYYGILQAVVAYSNHFGAGSAENRMVALLQEEKGKQVARVREVLREAAIARGKNTQQVGVRAW